MVQLNRLVDAGNTVIVVEHDMHMIAGSNWVMEIKPGAGEGGGRIVVRGRPEEVAGVEGSTTAWWLRMELGM